MRSGKEELRWGGPGRWCVFFFFLFYGHLGIFLVTCGPPRAQSVRNRGIIGQSHGKPPLLLRFYPKIPHFVSNPDRVMGSSPLLARCRC
jgi:hypothetical protein